ncbi:hypothetical protein [Corynebacterium sphenisci]|uniref:hypothetical protein n=1 Tax=Corynebacterium sphenisci TaxID=191493 RepID=UPI0026DFA0AE|nr:hypothetical protein [Corynebacterium sphenisci]MDO5730779.1 hypothetical protein [Corynebacterium sphenisci]
MPVSATMDDPQYTPAGAVFPIVTLYSHTSGVQLSIRRPDGLDADAALTTAEARTLYDYLGSHLEHTL